MDNIFKKDFIILDGATGTILQKSGLALGETPELLSITNKALIESVHERYFRAGSDIVYANTFGANRHKLAGSGHTVEEVVTNAVNIARKVADKYDGKVGLDIGPIGELLEPSGTLSFEDAYEIFSEVIVAGKNAGADVIAIETMIDLYEVKAAVLAAKENCDLPIFVTMTFEQNGRTFTGVGVENMAITLEGLGVDAIGINCSLGPVEILPLIQKMREYTSLPLIAKPNAGLPNPENGEYELGAEQFGALMADYAKFGVKVLGGCCGTDETFIKSLVDNIANIRYRKTTVTHATRVCSGTKMVTVDGIKVIGERINPTGKKRFADALRNHEIDYILRQVTEQVEAGADILDVNVGVPGLDEKVLMTEVVKAIQGITDVPLQIDASKFDTLEAGLRAYNGKPILNSVNGETENLHKILPIAKKYGACIIGLTIDEDGIPKTAEKRVEIARKILKTAQEYGIPKEDVIIDCLTLTVSAQQSDCIETLRAVATIKTELGLQTVLGVSNISFGLPNRELINQTFLVSAINHGLSLAIINPNSKMLMDTISAYNVLSAQDKDSVEYIARFQKSDEKKEKHTPQQSDITIEDAIAKGLSSDAAKLTKALLKTTQPLAIVNEILIPILDNIGNKFEKQEIFLPQLIRSATASCSAFDEIKTFLSVSGDTGVLKGKILLATVKGDVHDIGKNIVKVILENYGYQVVDLGKDVPADKIIQVATEQDIRLIGLSALMTTTVESMKDIICQIRKNGHDCKIMVGGAVLTEEYAMKIGADYYAKDAKQSADIAKEVLQ